jgi:hypothetical protein
VSRHVSRDVTSLPAGAGNASRRLDQTMAAAVGASRVFALAQTVAITRSIRGRVRHPRVLAAGVAGLVAQSAWAARRGWKQGSIRDRTIASSDAVAQCFALAVEAASWGSRSIPAEARWSETFGAVLTSWTSFEDPSPRATATSLLGWLGTYAIATGGRTAQSTPQTGQRVNEATGHATLTMAGRALGLQLVAQAAELDAARETAVEQAQSLAAARERQHQQRIMHDSALQILETVAGGWDVDDVLLVQRIDYEIARLERLLGTPKAGARGLAEALAALVATFALVGLAVDLDLSELHGRGPESCSEALASATHEALMNVVKHAQVHEARVRASGGADEIRIVIADDGRGFDPDPRTDGFGLNESIRGRMRDIGGSATVSSGPERGTLVELRVRL